MEHQIKNSFAGRGLDTPDLKNGLSAKNFFVLNGKNVEVKIFQVFNLVYTENGCRKSEQKTEFSVTLSKITFALFPLPF